MDSLLKLRAWLPIDDALSYLNKRLGAQISKGDLFRAALDGRLRLCVYLDFHMSASRAVDVSPRHSEEYELSAYYGGAVWVHRRISMVSGLVRLPMMLGDRRLVENECCRHEDRPPPKAFNILVEDSSGQLWQLKQLREYGDLFIHLLELRRIEEEVRCNRTAADVAEQAINTLRADYLKEMRQLPEFEQYTHYSVDRGVLQYALETSEIARLEKELSSTESAQSRWPWGNHETELLRWLEQAANKFWKSYKPGLPATAPREEEIMAWLADESSKGDGELSGRDKTAIVKLLRADDLPKGPFKVGDTR